MVHKRLAISLDWSMRRFSRTSPGSLICQRRPTLTKLFTAFVGVPLTLSRTARASRCSCVRVPAGSGCTRFASERPTSRFKTTKKETSLTFAHSANHPTKQILNNCTTSENVSQAFERQPTTPISHYLINSHTLTHEHEIKYTLSTDTKQTKNYRL